MNRGVPDVSWMTVLVAVAVFALAGCTAFGSSTGSPTGSPTTGEGYENLTAPAPPETLTAETAAETATRYHLARIVTQLGENGTIPDRLLPPEDAIRTEIANRSAGGYYAVVRVRPGSLREQNASLERAMYLLEEGEDPRLAAPLANRPVEPYRGSGEPAGPIDIRVANFGNDTANATIVVTQVDGRPETAYIGTVTVTGGTGLTVEDALATAGTYRVTAATENRSVSRSVAVRADGSGEPLGIFLGRDGQIRIQRGPG